MFTLPAPIAFCPDEPRSSRTFTALRQAIEEGFIYLGRKILNLQTRVRFPVALPNLPKVLNSAFRLFQQKHNHDHQDAWARFESQLAKRIAEIEQRHRDESQTLSSRIRELESAAEVSVEQKALDIQRVRAELEQKLRSEQSQKEDLNRRCRLQGIGTGKKGQRHELIGAYGYDIKAAMHVIQLLNEGIELMRSGTITLAAPKRNC